MNPAYVGEWKVYGLIRKVDLSYEEISAQNLYDYYVAHGEIYTGDEKDSNWRGIRFHDNGIVETDSGNQVYGYTQSDFWGSLWSDGWIISKSERTRAHAIIYEGDETLLLLELKNGDYFRGFAPTYMIFIKQ